MNYNRLYIIGNGFDLHHGLKSRYWDFRTYLMGKDDDLVEKLEEYFGEEALWSDFEETLSELDTEQIVDECSNYLVSYGADDWSDAYHHDYQYEVGRRIDLITKDLKNRFTEWVLQLALPSNADDFKIPIRPRSVFLNFNYTSTLQEIYGIANENIVYIHNRAIDKNSTLILGHSRKPTERKMLSENNDEDTDVRVAEANGILDAYFVDTYKPTETIIAENEAYFDSLRNLKEIYVLGHSLSSVDVPYFEQIINRIDKVTVRWVVSYYNQEEVAHHSEAFAALGINPTLVTFSRMSNIDTQQIGLFPAQGE